MSRLRLVIEQGRLPAYRVPFFDALARGVESLTVAHSGARAAADAAAFEERILSLRSIGPLRFQPELADVSRGADVLVVMFDLRWPMNLLETVSGRRAHRNLVWGHGLGRRRALWPLRLAWIQRTDGIILYHRGQADQLAELGIPEEKIFVAPNAVAMPESVPSASHRDSILFVGRLQPRKRLDVLVDAFARLKADGARPELTLDLVGSGDKRPSLERRVRRHGLEASVHFHGPVYDEARLACLFARAIVYASPGWTGLGLLHAFAHGVPAVIGDGIRHPPEAQDLVPGVNGLRVAPESDGFAEALARVVDDRDFRDQLGKAAAELVRTRRRMKDMVRGFMEAVE